MKTTVDLSELLGRPGLMPCEAAGSSGYGLQVAVVVVDARVMWGKVQVQVRPEAGTGRAWVNVERVRWVAPAESEATKAARAEWEAARPVRP